MKKVSASKALVPNMIERPHSPLGASSSERWFNCAASVKLCEEVPPSESGAAALEGTAAHALAEKVFKETPNAFYYVGKESKLGAEFTEHKIKCTQDMATHVQSYVDFVRAKARELKGKLFVEKVFHLKHIHPMLYGTADAVIVAEKEIWVIDFKFGIGHVVEVEENSQLLYYATGATMGIDTTKLKRITVCVVQPRFDHEDGTIRTWSFDPQVIRDFSKKLRIKALETERDDAPFNAGDWCRWCPAAGVCPALHRRTIETAKTDFDDEPKLPDVRRLSDEQLAKVIRYHKVIERWFESVKDYAKTRALAGEAIEGVKLVPGRGSRKWKDEAKAKAVLESELGDEAFKITLLSVAQAEDKLGAGALDGLWEKIEGNPTIAHETDKRQALKPDAKDDFDPDFDVDDDDF